jgi:hypothetical protein
MIEGLPLGRGFAPSGPITWFVALYAGIGTIVTWLSHNADTLQFPGVLRPVAALEVTLFRIYADLSVLRLTVALFVSLLSLWAVWAIARFGYKQAGSAGALAGGLLAAALPIVLDMSVQTRPYGVAWSFALLAAAAAATGRERSRALRAGVCLGVAVASRIDMVMVGPLVLLVLCLDSNDSKQISRAVRIFAAASMISFLLVAPWYLPHLVDNLRNILSVRILHTLPNAGGAAFEAWRTWLAAGIATPLIVALAGLLTASLTRRWIAVACGVWLLVLAVLGSHPDSFGLRHDGALVVAIIIAAPLGLRMLGAFCQGTNKQVFSAVLVIFACAPALWYGLKTTASLARSRAPDDSITWIEQHVPPGKRVFAQGLSFQTLLPTAEAGERLWSQVVEPNAWLGKWDYDVAKCGYGGFPPLRVMSEDHLAQDRGNRRRYYILAAPVSSDRPRYDLWIVSEGSFYDLHANEAMDRLCKEGGVYLHRGAPISQLPAPAASWPGLDSEGTYIYRVAPGSCAGAGQGGDP